MLVTSSVLATNYIGVDYMENYNIEVPTKKACFNCKKELPANTERFSKRGKGLRGTCKKCEKERKRKYYLENKSKFKENSREYEAKKREEYKQKKIKTELEVTAVGNWKEVEGYEQYLISDEGKLFSRKSGKLLKLQARNDGYIVAGITKNEKVKNVYIHRLVMKAFKPEGEKETVNHIDGNKANNHVDNLEWCTYSENNQHAIKTGLNTTEHKINKKGSKPVSQYDLEGNLIKTYPSMRQAERETGINATSIGHGIRKGWNYGGFMWKFSK